MRFLADESCDFAAVRALRAAGYDVDAVKDRFPGATDEEVVKIAVQESRILLTEDKDFGQLFFAGAPQSAGVILVRFPGNARESMTDALVSLVRQHGNRLGDRFVVLQPGRVRMSRRVMQE